MVLRLKKMEDIMYCEKCGTKLIDKLTFLKFYKQTGEKLYKKYSHCPKAKWYNSGLHTFVEYNDYFYENGASWIGERIKEHLKPIDKNTESN